MDTNQSDPESQRLNPRNNNMNALNIMNGGGIGSKQPKDENYWDMLQLNLCPRFKVASFTFGLTVTNIAIFIAIFCASLNDLDNDDFMGISSNKLSSFGAKNTYDIRYHYQIYRWFLPIFLHANFMHIFFNSVTLFWIGFNVEQTIGKLAFLILYLFSGIGGFIFSSLVNDSIAVGASGAIFGIISVMLVNIVLNWRAMYNSGALMPTIIMMIMVILMAFVGGDNTDIYGHLGGLFFGILLSTAILKYNSSANCLKIFSFAGWVSIFIYAVTTGT